MKVILRWTAALYLCCASTVAFAGKLPGGTGISFLVGYNEAWFGLNYGNSIASNPSFFCLSSSFDSNFVDTMFAGMQAGGAKVVRIWVFPALQGIQLSTACPIAPPPAPPPQTIGLTNDLKGNLQTVFTEARNHGLKVYVTALNGNDMSDPATNITGLRSYFQNLLTDTTEMTRFQQNVLGPLVDLLNATAPDGSRNRDVIYALDLINEIQAPLTSHYPNFGWKQAQAWIKNMTDFVKLRPCEAGCVTGSWLPVTSSSWSVSDITVGLFSGLHLDFYDVHVYADLGQYSGVTWLCNRVSADGVPIILGEYGQKTHTFDDSLQYSTTSNFLTTAKAHCFSAALAWMYETKCDPRFPGCPSQGYDWWTYLIPGPGPYGGKFRPAYSLIH
jgi:hypothetical protein